MAEDECEQSDPPPWVIGRDRRPIEKWTRRELQRRAKKVTIAHAESFTCLFTDRADSLESLDGPRCKSP